MFFKSPTHWAFWVLLGLGFIGIFGFFYLIEQLGSLLVDLSHHLSYI